MADDNQTDEVWRGQDKVKVYEEILRANPVRFAEETPAEEAKPSSREILFRGSRLCLQCGWSADRPVSP